MATVIEAPSIRVPTELSYNSDTHVYTFNGKPWPGMTTVLDGLGYYPDKEYYTDNSRWRGTAIHSATEIVDQLCPDATSLEEVLEAVELDHPDPEKKAWLLECTAGWIQIKQELGFTPVHREKVVCSTRMSVAGTFDFWGINRRGQSVLLDLKGWKNAGPTCPRHAQLQVAGYEVMLGEMGVKTDLRYVAALTGNPNMRYRIYPCKATRDKLVAQELADIWWDKYMSGLIKIKGER